MDALLLKRMLSCFAGCESSYFPVVGDRQQRGEWGGALVIAHCAPGKQEYLRGNYGDLAMGKGIALIKSESVCPQRMDVVVKNRVFGLVALGAIISGGLVFGGSPAVAAACVSSFTNKTTTVGLGDNAVFGVSVVGSSVFAATAGGLSISTDGGATFTNKTTADGLGNIRVDGVYAVGSNVFAATDGGLSISTDGGATFTNKTTTDGLGDNFVHGVYAVGSNVYAATDGGLSISTDGGTSFTNKSTTDGLGWPSASGVYVVGNNVYAATAGGLSISTDGGATFTNKTTADGLGNNIVDHVYADDGNVYAATRGGLSISADCASLPTLAQTGADLSLVVVGSGMSALMVFVGVAAIRASRRKLTSN